MKILSENELLKTIGGVDISGALLNSFSSLFKIILEVGRSIGSGLRRFYDGSTCSL